MSGSWKILLPGGIILAMGFTVYWFHFAQEPQDILLLDQWSRVQRLWQQGDLVLLIRHAQRCDRSEASCLSGHTGITWPGLFMEDDLGYEIVDHMDLERAGIFHSPVKRTAQTARFLFHDTSREASWLRHECKTQMQREILAHKKKGTNLVLVTHASCMSHLADARGNPLIPKQTLGDDSYGITWFLAVDESGKQLSALGYLLPGEWEELPIKPTRH